MLFLRDHFSDLKQEIEAKVTAELKENQAILYATWYNNEVETRLEQEIRNRRAEYFPNGDSLFDTTGGDGNELTLCHFNSLDEDDRISYVFHLICRECCFAQERGMSASEFVTYLHEKMGLLRKDIGVYEEEEDEDEDEDEDE